jgi:hypothetical protein
VRYGKRRVEPERKCVDSTGRDFAGKCKATNNSRNKEEEEVMEGTRDSDTDKQNMNTNQGQKCLWDSMLGIKQLTDVGSIVDAVLSKT